MDFKQEIANLEDRIKESRRLMLCHPGKIPIIVEPFSRKNSELKTINNKFLVPKHYSFHELLYHIRRKLDIVCASSLCILVDKKIMPSMAKTIIDIYEEYKDSDGFLYIQYASEHIWGSSKALTHLRNKKYIL